jgi:hypothetical protein
VEKPHRRIDHPQFQPSRRLACVHHDRKVCAAHMDPDPGGGLRAVTRPGHSMSARGVASRYPDPRHRTRRCAGAANGLTGSQFIVKHLRTVIEDSAGGNIIFTLPLSDPRLIKIWKFHFRRT